MQRRRPMRWRFTALTRHVETYSRRPRKEFDQTNLIMLYQLVATASSGSVQVSQ
jgi:hypothetical protein